MNLYHDVKQDEAPVKLYVITEIAKGDFVKYEFNHEYNVLEVDRVLHGPVHYPTVYADVPRTWNIEDEDPLDAVVFTTGNILPGTLVKGRVLGVMKMTDNGESDDKIICVNDTDPRYKHAKDIDDISPSKLKDLQTFMETYKYAQTGPGSVVVLGFENKEKAYEVIKTAMQAYKDKFPNGSNGIK